MEISKKICVIVLVVVQGCLLLSFICFGVLQRLQVHRIRSAWSEFANGNDSLEVMGEIDFNEDLSWLSFTKARNVTRQEIHDKTLKTDTTLQKVNLPTTKTGIKLLFPNIRHKPGEIFMFVFVTTIPKAAGKREVIRSTWGSVEKYHKTNSTPSGTNTTNAANVVVYLSFMLGNSGDIKIDTDVEAEASKYGDILRGDFKETYRNIVIKVWFAFNWALLYKPSYVLKVDDDMYAHIPRFISWLHKPSTPEKLYAGYVHFNAYISRDPRNAHYVSKQEFPERRFPNYCAGPCYIFSGNLLETFLKQAKKVPIFRVEDAFLGFIARKSKVKPLDIGGKLYVWDRSLRKWVRNWPDSRLTKAICLGDKLDPYTIQYLHSRFLKLKF